MARRASVAQADQRSLYLCESAIAKRVGKTPREWAAISVILEREGLPRVCPLMGGRYWPAVRAFLDRRHGLRGVTPANVDGEETWS